ncbi:MAG: metallophosphatase family protein [Treponema sp.]|jgi:predicted phosphodiesterase|nr:metallophosphatase family protein [Treponema sp.]
MRLLIAADIHANVSALEAVLRDVAAYHIERTVLLGDHIDYGMRPNEVIALVKEFPYPIDVNIWGNHEKAIMDGNLERFSSERGRAFSTYTRKLLSEESKKYIRENMNASGWEEQVYDDKRYMMIHGSVQDVFWQGIFTGTDVEPYSEYDYVLCGHSHRPFCFEKYAAIDNPGMRNMKKTVFINPGSVGQPRNHQPCACYAVLDTATGWVHLNTAHYNVTEEQKLYGDNVDVFYKTRLERGV